MFVNNIAKHVLILLYIFYVIHNVTANSHDILPSENKFKCIRLNEPPYFYCNLSENLKSNNDAIAVRITPTNERESYPLYPSETSTTTQAPELATTILEVLVPKTDSVAAEKSSSKFENIFSTTEKSHIFTTITSGFTADTFLTAENTRATITTTAPPKDDNDFIISELSQPLKQHNGPTIMEEIFIDTLTKSQQQQQQINQEKESTFFEPFHNELLMHSNRHLFMLCRRFLPFARAHCHRERTPPKFVERCRGYFQDCDRYIIRADPLQEAARALQMNVRYGNHEFPFQSFPQYF